jgi:2OG-Fe(II) oxygenase superfamily
MQGARDAAALDEAWLSRWVSPSCLSGDALLRAARSYRDHPLRVVAMPAFLKGDVAERVSGFLLEEAVYETTFGLYSKRNQDVTREEWEGASDADRFFRYGSPVATGSHDGLSDGLVSFLQLRAAMHDRRFLELITAIVGSEIGKASLYSRSMQAGDFLRDHNDDRLERAVAFVLFMSPDWPSELGGGLEIRGRSGDRWVHPPMFNTLVLFDVTAHDTHAVLPIASTAGTRRRASLGGWFEK